MFLVPDFLKKLRKRIISILNRFRDHLDGAARALFHAHSAAFTVVVIEAESVSGPELKHRIVRTDTIAVIALEAVAAGQATARFEQRIALI